VRPSDRSILLDLLLDEISSIWGPSWLPIKKPENEKFPLKFEQNEVFMKNTSAKGV
jgi:hypothetical protein